MAKSTIRHTMFNEETGLKTCSDAYKNERGETEKRRKGKPLPRLWQAQSPESSFSRVTGEAQGMQHGSNELGANPNKGDGSLVLHSLLRNFSYCSGTNKAFCKTPLPILLRFFQTTKKHKKFSQLKGEH